MFASQDLSTITANILGSNKVDETSILYDIIFSSSFKLCLVLNIHVPTSRLSTFTSESSSYILMLPFEVSAMFSGRALEILSSYCLMSSLILGSSKNALMTVDLYISEDKLS